MAADSAEGAIGSSPPSVRRKRRRHRSRPSRSLPRRFSGHRIRRMAFLVFVILLSLGVAFWITHRDSGPAAEQVN